MSDFEGKPMKGMNPFGNNQPSLTASERIRNKRDTTIYQTEKQQFQTKNKCGGRNVKYYNNGMIRSMKSYKLQKSLARGSVLCEDCDEKGSLCKGPSSKDDLNSIQMSNNLLSEFWGGSEITYHPHSSTAPFQQTGGFTIINADVEGQWSCDTTPICIDSKPAIGPDGSLNNIPIPYGYANDLFNIPRNLNGNGILIDPSNTIFPDELCDPFRYLKYTNLKTYIVLTMPIPIDAVAMAGIATQPVSCDSIKNGTLVETFVLFQAAGGSNIFNGVVQSLCCVGNFTLPTIYCYAGTTVNPGTFGLFKVYIRLFNILNYPLLSKFLNATASIGSNNLSIWPSELSSGNPAVLFLKGNLSGSESKYYMELPFIRSIDIFQGTIPPSLTQTKYNATKQSYMSCLENGTRKINFTKQNTKIPVTASYCTPCEPIIPKYEVTYEPSSSVSKQVGSERTIYTIDTAGETVTFDVNILNSGCGGGVEMLFTIYGGGGGGGSGNVPNNGGTPYYLSSAGGGGEAGGAAEVALLLHESTDFIMLAGHGGSGNKHGITDDPSGAGHDGSGSWLCGTDSTNLNVLLSQVVGGHGGKYYELEQDNNVYYGAGAGGNHSDGGGGSGAKMSEISFNNYYKIPVAGGGGAGGGFFDEGVDGQVEIDPSVNALGGDGGAAQCLPSTCSVVLGGGGGGGALPYWFDTSNGGSFQDASGVGGSGGKHNGGAQGGGNGAGFSFFNAVAYGTKDGLDATSFGGGGGGGVSYNYPGGTLVKGGGGDGKRGLIVINMANSA